MGREHSRDPPVFTTTSLAVVAAGGARTVCKLRRVRPPPRIRRDVIARSLSVRETESIVKKLVEAGASPNASSPPKPPKPADVHTRAAEDRLRLVLGTRVRIVRRGTAGRIEIDFASEDELIRLFDQLTERQ